MTNENLLRYCETNNIPLNETNNDRSLIIQGIHYIQPSTFRDMPLEGVQWYIKARRINVNGNESCDDMMILIKRYNKDIKEGRTIDPYRVSL